MNSRINIRTGLVLVLIIFAALTRLFPHPPNFTAIGAMGLFGAAHFKKKHLAFLIPLAAMWFSDLILNNLVYAKMYPEFYKGFVWMGSLWVYGAFALIVGLGFLLLRKVRVTNLFLASLIASFLFFLVTNLGAWAGNPLYPQTITGLLLSYEAGLPFLLNTILGDLFFVAVLFGSYALIKDRYPQFATAA